jgi:hypothetical protein
MRTNLRLSLGTLSLALAGALAVFPTLASAQTTTTTTTTAPPAPAVPPPEAYAPAAGPQYDEVTESYNAPMFTSGALVFAASYGASAIVASQDSSRGNNRLFVPVLGPWLALGDRGSCDVTKSSCDHETTAKVLLVADGIFQAAGVIGMLDALLQPTTHRVVASTARRDAKKVHVTPTMTNGNPGFAALGRF